MATRVNPSALLEPIVVAVSRDGQTINGTGFYINQELVATCYHVLSPSTEPLQKQYWIRHDEWDKWVIAEPLSTYCHLPPRDTAILRCTRKIPMKTSFRFANWDTAPQEFIARGYDRAKNAFGIGATMINGEILGVTTYKNTARLQLRAEEGTILQGRSGSPVCTTQQNHIVGMIDFLGEGLDAKSYEMALAIPIDEILPNINYPFDRADPLQIQIRRHYRREFEFSLVSEQSSNWVVNRLFLKYLNEFRWVPQPPHAEAMIIPYSYAIPLSRRYSEYDLLPLTPDNERALFAYRGPDADHFSIDLSGTNVSKVSICADLYDLDSQQSIQVKSKELEIVASSGVQPIWDQPLGVADRRLTDQFSLVTYKVVISRDPVSFLMRLQDHHVATVKLELEAFLKTELEDFLLRNGSERAALPEIHEIINARKGKSMRLARGAPVFEQLLQVIQQVIENSEFPKTGILHLWDEPYWASPVGQLHRDSTLIISIVMLLRTIEKII